LELEQPSSCSLDAREVKLEELIGGEDPMLMEIETDELIAMRGG
jgi:hypothetical protein